MREWEEPAAGCMGTQKTWNQQIQDALQEASPDRRPDDKVYQ